MEASKVFSDTETSSLSTATETGEVSWFGVSTAAVVAFVVVIVSVVVVVVSAAATGFVASSILLAAVATIFDA